MAKKYKTSLKRKNAFFMDFDTQKLANAIEAAGGNIKPAIEAATRKSLPIIQAAFKQEAVEHTRSGDMESTLIDASQTPMIWGKQAKKRFVATTTKGVKGFSGGKVEVVDEESVLFFEYGFDANKQGGLRALWLDVGTPNRPPTKKGKNTGKVKGDYFIFYAVENNLSKIHAIQKQELMRIVESLKGG